MNEFNSRTEEDETGEYSSSSCSETKSYSSYPFIVLTDYQNVVSSPLSTGSLSLRTSPNNGNNVVSLTTHACAIARRNKRKKLNKQFRALSTILPGPPKIHKASLLRDAIEYLKELEKQEQLLKEQMKEKPTQSIAKYCMSADGETWSFSENSHKSLPEVQARFSEKSVLIQIHSEKQKGFIVKVLAAIEKLHLSVVNSNVLTFGKCFLDMTLVAQMDDEFQMTAKDLETSLRMAIL